MALTRRRWNNIIIIACLLMIGVLTLLDRYTDDAPSDTVQLFDQQNPLSQLQLAGVWLAQTANGHWQCDERVLNCSEWVEHWQQLRVSAVELPANHQPADQPEELLIQVGQQQSQVWWLFPSVGMLRSAAGNWYEIPPSQRDGLQPLFKAEVK
ncbi:hypothetical protein HR45_19090 [Shewanella mangrovi]|uniref:Uncharacterized protein n=1 Tax=Shewanella mangrovi TaxID=1515746 RepID=A0A094JU10_9GAMM|nr:hypothetical protein [Shewanella mangrovi]KFZ35956.1 hypothetical protein HR45_19090 [Shewanella mangrovi]